MLLLALPAAASSCVPWPLPFVMGYADTVDVTPEGALHVAWLCEPTLMVIPVSAADDLRFGLRPFYAWGRWGPAVEVTLGEARARRAARIKEDRDRRVSACRSRREPAMAAWRVALEGATAALLADKPGCIAAIDQVDAELASCVGRPAYERVRAVDHVVDTLTTVHTLADAIAALEAGASLPPAWRADTDAAAICAEVPLDARAGPW